MAKTSKSASPFEGRWRITSMTVWSQDVVDAEVEGFVEFGPNGLGSFQFAYVSGDINVATSYVCAEGSGGGRKDDDD